MANPLRGYRKKHRLSQQDVAERLGKSRSWVAMVEAGARPYTADMALLIEERLGINRMLTLPRLFRHRRAAD